MTPFAFLKKMGRRDTVGLDWGTQSIKWVKIQPFGKGRFRLLFADSLPLPDEETQILNVLKKFVLKHGMAGTPTAVGFQDDRLHIRRLELPRMPPDDLREAIRWQMRDIAEGTMDDYIVKSSLLEEVTTGDVVKLRLLGYAVQKNIVLNRTRLLQKVGLKPFFAEPAAVSLAFCVDSICPTTQKEWVVCVDIGFQHATFIAVGNRTLSFVKPLTKGLFDVSQPQNFSTQLSLEIQHAMDAFSIVYHPEKIEKIFLSGGCVQDGDLPSILTKNLGIPTEILNPFQGIEGTSQYPQALQKSSAFGAAVGLSFLQL